MSGLHLQTGLANERWQVRDRSCHSPSLPPSKQLQLTSSLYVLVWYSLKTHCSRQRARGSDKVPSYGVEFMKKLRIGYLCNKWKATYSGHTCTALMISASLRYCDIGVAFLVTNADKKCMCSRARVVVNRWAGTNASRDQPVSCRAPSN